MKVLILNLKSWDFRKLSASNEKIKTYFLTSDELQFFEVFCELIVPSGPDPKREPGAKEVGAANYVDSDLSTFPGEIQEYYRESIRLVDELSERKFGRSFVNLSNGDKNILLRDLYLNPKTRERMFDLRSLALEGFYSDYHDPWYEGVSGWEFTGFSGKRISDLKKDWTFLRIWKDWESKR